MIPMIPPPLDINTEIDINFPLPDKMLVFAVPQTAFLQLFTLECWERAIAHAIYLRGGDFGVRVIQVGDALNSTMTNNFDSDDVWFTEYLHQMLEDGKQVDIAILSSDDFKDEFFSMYQKGHTLALDNWLQSESGQRLYQHYPPAVWDVLRINGNIHGLMNLGMRFGNMPGYIIRDSWIEENNFDVSNLTYNPRNLISMICDETHIRLDALEIIKSNFSLSSMLNGIVFVDGNATSLFEHSLIFDYKYARYEFNNNDFDNVFDIVFSESIPNVFPFFVHDENETYTFFPVNSPNLDSLPAATVINPNSDYINESLEFLTWLKTDSEFADLFVYGVENIHERHGFSWRSFQLGAFFSSTIPYDAEGYEDAAQRLMKHFWTLESAAHTGFRFDRRGIEEQIEKIENIIFNYMATPCPNWDENRQWLSQDSPFRNITAVFIDTPFAEGTDPDWEQTLANLNADLREAGIGELIEEVQRQYDEWFALHSPVNR